MMDAYDQQRAYRRWLLAANGDLSVVEQALIQATSDAGDAPPTFDAVMGLIRRYVGDFTPPPTHRAAQAA